MSYTLQITEAAEQDLEKIVFWYDNQKVLLGQDFINCFFEAGDFIAKNPIAIQVKYENIRIYFLKKFPYGIHYFIEDNLVTIIAVFGTNENPNKWGKSRIQ